MRLNLTRRSDYAVRAMRLLAARPGKTVSSSSIRDATSIPARFVVPVMSDLARASLVETTLGRSGGYRLKAEPAQVSVLSIVSAVEGERRRTECALSQRPCGTRTCALHPVLERANQAFRDELSAISLATLVDY
jgi:Rrf2 family protein